MKWGVLEAGQLVTTMPKLAFETGLSTQSVRNSLSKLKRTDNISVQITNRFSVITIVNWALYQSANERTTDKATAKRARVQQSNVTGSTGKTDSFLLSNKNERNKEELGVSSEQNTVPFEEFWSLYPRKEDKLAARKKWETLKPDATLFAKMKAVIEAKRNSEEWCKDNGKFIPMPSTWLHRRRWEDETPENRTTQNPDRKTDLDELF